MEQAKVAVLTPLLLWATAELEDVDQRFKAACTTQSALVAKIELQRLLRPCTLHVTSNVSSLPCVRMLLSQDIPYVLSALLTVCICVAMCAMSECKHQCCQPQKLVICQAVQKHVV